MKVVSRFLFLWCFIQFCGVNLALGSQKPQSSLSRLRKQVHQSLKKNYQKEDTCKILQEQLQQAYQACENQDRICRYLIQEYHAVQSRMFDYEHFLRTAYLKVAKYRESGRPGFVDFLIDAYDMQAAQKRFETDKNFDRDNFYKQYCEALIKYNVLKQQCAYVQNAYIGAYESVELSTQAYHSKFEKLCDYAKQRGAVCVIMHALQKNVVAEQMKRLQKEEEKKQLEKKQHEAACIITGVVRKFATVSKEQRLHEQQKKEKQAVLEQKSQQALEYFADFSNLLEKQRIAHEKIAQEARKKADKRKEARKQKKAILKKAKLSHTNSAQQQARKDKAFDEEIESLYNLTQAHEQRLVALMGKDSSLRKPFDQTYVDKRDILIDAADLQCKRLYPLQKILQEELQDYVESLLDIADDATILQLKAEREVEHRKILQEKIEEHEKVAILLAEYKSILKEGDACKKARFEEIKKELTEYHEHNFADHGQVGLPYYIFCNIYEFIEIRDLLEQLQYKQICRDRELDLLDKRINIIKPVLSCVKSKEKQLEFQIQLQEHENKYAQLLQDRSDIASIIYGATMLQGPAGILNPLDIAGKELILELASPYWYQHISCDQLDAQKLVIRNAICTPITGEELIDTINFALKETLDVIDLYKPEHRFYIARELVFKALKEVFLLVNEYTSFKRDVKHNKKKLHEVDAEFEEILNTRNFQAMWIKQCKDDAQACALGDFILKPKIADFAKIYSYMQMQMMTLKWCEKI